MTTSGLYAQQKQSRSINSTSIHAVTKIPPPTTKSLIMKSKFKRWIRNWINEGQDTIGRIEESSELNTEGPMRITIHKAAGGLIVETRSYDNLKDRSHQRLHIVTHDQDLAQSLTKIITMESLRG
ncbi:hypothetical protein EB118_23180 [bacterium]|nr:hypothetical protein [bacterium]